MEYYKYLRQYVGHAPLILPGAVVIIFNSQNEVLLQKRPEGRWGLPGGLMNVGESFEQVAVREVYEELGIKLRNLQFLNVFSGERYYTKAANGDEFYSVTAVYITREELYGEFCLEPSETVEISYFAIGELPDNIVGSHREFILSID